MPTLTRAQATPEAILDYVLLDVFGLPSESPLEHSLKDCGYPGILDVITMTNEDIDALRYTVLIKEVPNIVAPSRS